jgi:chaperonin GroEL
MKRAASTDEQIGIKMVENACLKPIQAILENAGKDASSIIETLVEAKDPQQGYDAKNHEFVNMFEKGIVDPTKVVRIALEDAASVAALMTTTEAMVVDMPEAKDGATGAGAGGMY